MTIYITALLASMRINRCPFGAARQNQPKTRVQDREQPNLNAPARVITYANNGTPRVKFFVSLGAFSMFGCTCVFRRSFHHHQQTTERNAAPSSSSLPPRPISTPTVTISSLPHGRLKIGNDARFPLLPSLRRDVLLQRALVGATNARAGTHLRMPAKA